MDDVTTAIILEQLDEESATFYGGDTATIQRQTIMGQTVQVAARFPMVTIPKTAWVDMGCPTSLSLTLSEYVVNDAPDE